MGKYSLENYEQYKTKKIRPVLSKTAPDNYGRGQITYITYSWAELEPLRGCYKLDFIMPKLTGACNPVLIFHPESPDWVKENAEECFARFIRRVGSYLADNPYAPLGILITTISNSRTEWAAYTEGFQEARLFADLHHDELIEFLRRQNKEFGLRIVCGEANWRECCEAFARLQLQHNWEKQPNLLHVSDETCGEQITSQAIQWHASFSNKKINLGYNLAVRRVTYPETVSGNGVLPIRFWFVNNGSAPYYGDLCIMLKLTSKDETYKVPLQSTPKVWSIGDIVHNEILQLPDMREGNYSISVGLFTKQNTPIIMGIEQITMDGFYPMGELNIDNINRDELHNIWEHYYPEGYYPLEDPQSPETSE